MLPGACFDVHCCHGTWRYTPTSTFVDVGVVGWRIIDPMSRLRIEAIDMVVVMVVATLARWPSIGSRCAPPGRDAQVDGGVRRGTGACRGWCARVGGSADATGVPRSETAVLQRRRQADLLSQDGQWSGSVLGQPAVIDSGRRLLL